MAEAKTRSGSGLQGAGKGWGREALPFERRGQHLHAGAGPLAGPAPAALEHTA
ncbi:MAG: hypothetical protein K2X67_04640 [Burkholderiales bacterium]|nr:hypothetical protein [Burkholderiales bacterium]